MPRGEEFAGGFLHGQRHPDSGTFGVFVPGKLEARLFDKHGAPIANIVLQAVNPAGLAELHVEL